MLRRTIGYVLLCTISLIGCSSDRQTTSIDLTSSYLIDTPSVPSPTGLKSVQSEGKSPMLSNGLDSLLNPTPEWISLYCAYPTLDGVVLEPGDTISVYDPDGVMCGIDIVRESDTAFGFMPVYHDDPFSDIDEGAEVGDTLSFAINFQAVRVSDAVVWTANGDRFIVCSFSSITDANNVVAIDIKPGSCPNPFNLTGNLARGKSVLPVAILGSATFDVRDIDVSTIRLESVASVRHSYEDVATPFNGDSLDCGCNDLNGDGYEDITLKFSRYSLMLALGYADDDDGDHDDDEGDHNDDEGDHDDDHHHREPRRLHLVGQLIDGTLFTGSDCVLLIRNK